MPNSPHLVRQQRTSRRGLDRERQHAAAVENTCPTSGHLDTAVADLASVHICAFKRRTSPHPPICNRTSASPLAARAGRTHRPLLLPAPAHRCRQGHAATSYPLHTAATAPSQNRTPLGLERADARSIALTSRWRPTCRPGLADLSAGRAIGSTWVGWSLVCPGPPLRTA